MSAKWLPIKEIIFLTFSNTIIFCFKSTLYIPQFKSINYIFIVYTKNLNDFVSVERTTNIFHK